MRLLFVGLAFFASVLAAQGPTVIFSTYLGVADCDGIALGSNGDLYLACHSPSNHLPIEAKPLKQSASEGDSDAYFDAYVLRLNPQTGKLIHATRVGGSDYDEAARIKVDRNGFAYVVGLTKSRDFPTTANAVQPQYGGGTAMDFLSRSLRTDRSSMQPF
jgi:Beta-propeller repeat